MNILEFKKKETIEENKVNEEVDLFCADDFPKRRVPNQYIVVEHSPLSSKADDIKGFFNDEISALKAYKKIPHGRKSLYFGTGVYIDCWEYSLIYDYENAKKIQ